MATKIKTTKASNESVKSKSTERPRAGLVKVPAKAAKAAKSTHVGPKGQEGRTEPTSGLNAAFRVLQQAGKPLKVKAIVETALAKGYWKTNGKTPAATIYSSIIREIAVKKAQSRFKKTGRGLFAVHKGTAK